jgi:hypothetical protein
MGGRRRRPLSAAVDGATVDARLVGVAFFALVVGLAADDGGFRPLSWDRALVGIAVLAPFVRLRRPGRDGALFLCALAALAAWTTASWLWSASPASALDEAQRVTLYALVATAVVLCRPLGVRPAVAGATIVVACWNLVAGGNAPIGYANALALLCALGLVLLPSVPRWTWLGAVPLVVVLVRQHSLGAEVALVAGAIVFLAPRLRLVVVPLAVAALLVAPFAVGGHEREHYWRAAAREAEAHPVLGGGAGTFVNWWVRERDVPLQTEEAHSLYVETLGELGPLGLALALAVFAIPLATARRPELAAGVAVYAVGVTVDFDWELAAVTVPAIVLAALAVSDARPRPLRARVVIPAAAAFAVAGLLAYVGNSRLSAAQDAAGRGDFAAAQSDARAALRWQPYSPQPWLVIGDVTHDAGAYRRAVALDPADWLLWQRLASVESGRLRRLAEAKAAQLNPLGGASGS